MLGIALLYMRLALLFQDRKSHYMSKAKSLIDSSLRLLDGKNCQFFFMLIFYERLQIGRIITFLCGDPGPLAIAAVISYNSSDQKTADKCIEK